MSEVGLSNRLLVVLWDIALLAAVISLFGTRLVGAHSIDHTLAAHSNGRFMEAAETATSNPSAVLIYDELDKVVPVHGVGTAKSSH